MMNVKFIKVFLCILIISTIILLFHFNRYEYVRVNYLDGDVTLRFDNLFPNRDPCVIETDISYEISSSGEFGLVHQTCITDYFNYYE